MPRRADKYGTAPGSMSRVICCCGWTWWTGRQLVEQVLGWIWTGSRRRATASPRPASKLPRRWHWKTPIPLPADPWTAPDGCRVSSRCSPGRTPAGRRRPPPGGLHDAVGRRGGSLRLRPPGSIKQAVRQQLIRQATSLVSFVNEVRVEDHRGPGSPPRRSAS